MQALRNGNNCRIPVLACPGLCFVLCPLVPIVVLWLVVVWLFLPKRVPWLCLVFWVPPLGEEMHMAPKADMRSESKSGLPDPFEVSGTDEKLEVAFLGVVLVP